MPHEAVTVAAPHPPRRARPRRRRTSSLVAAVALLGLAVSWATPAPARATVRHGVGLEGTVLGWTSWYGSYDLPAIGTTYCIDHATRAPDGAFDYRSTSLAISTSDLTAMAWMAGRYGPSPDPVDAAALMLALHDVRGAPYPYGRLRVDELRPDQLAGFGGRSASVLARARAIHADGIAHRSLVGPITLALRWIAPGPAAADDATGREGAEAPPRVVAVVADAAGRPVSGVVVRFALAGAAPASGLVATTAVDGTASVTISQHEPGATAAAQADVPDLHPALYAPTRAVAQRVILPRVQRLSAQATVGRAAPAPTTTTPTTTPTTTRPPTTPPPTTPPPTTRPTTPPTTSAPTTAPAAAPATSSTVPATTAPTPTTAPARAVPSRLASPSPRAPLARTGSPLRAWAMIACGLLLLGAALSDLTARRYRR